MRRVYILYYNFLDSKGENLKVGGIETYIIQLILLIKKIGLDPVIIQKSDVNFEKEYLNTKVIGLKCLTKKPRIELIRFCEKLINNDLDIVIFASNSINAKHNFNKAVSIQHGICWDVPYKNKYSKYLFTDVMSKAYKAVKLIKEINYVENTVCVDYNFINWYRTQVSKSNINLFPIPNFVNLNGEITKKENEIPKIIFARRFEMYRGTRLFASVIKRLLKENIEFEVIIAGEGSDEEWLHQQLGRYKNISFIKYNPEDSLKVHIEADIAVIPTIGSEGTSLSLLEAMGAKCAVIASNVGGMTNIVLDQFNGLLISPTEEQLYNAIYKLLKNREYRKMLGENASYTVLNSFSHSIWEEKWRDLLIRLINDDSGVQR